MQQEAERCALELCVKVDEFYFVGSEKVQPISRCNNVDPNCEVVGGAIVLSLTACPNVPSHS